MLTIDDLKAQQLILLECISGSKAYGLDTKESDTDIKGVFYLPKSYYYGLHQNYIAQISNESNDIIYYELGRFIELLLQNNPNIMELLNTPADKILYKNPLMDRFKKEWFISKLCQQTFVGFANSQIKKSTGLNKKINNPMAKKRKSLLDFCYVLEQEKSIPLTNWLAQQNLTQDQLGLSKIPHTKDIYALYVNDGHQTFHGVIQKETTNQVILSSIPKGLRPTAYLSFNQMGYSKYCTDHTAYWQWVNNRNDHRYQTTLNHGQGYDSKNMMHTFRLLQMALDIAKTGNVLVKRNNRDELLKIKAGHYTYDKLVNWATQLSDEANLAFQQSQLPDAPNKQAITTTLIDIRQQLYNNPL